jgi:hypothetical protein
MVKAGNYYAMSCRVSFTFRSYNIFISRLKVFNAIDKAAGNSWSIAKFYFDTSYRCYTAYQYKVVIIIL